MTTKNDNAAKALRLDQITERAARETAGLEAEIARLKTTATKLADAIAEAAADVCNENEERHCSRQQTNWVEPYARELGAALKELCEKRERLQALQHLIGA